MAETLTFKKLRIVYRFRSDNYFRDFLLGMAADPQDSLILTPFLKWAFGNSKNNCIIQCVGRLNGSRCLNAWAG